MLAESGWNVVFLGTGAFGDAGTLEFPDHDRVTVHRMPFCRGGISQKIHYLIFNLWAIGWALAWRPEWVYASEILACPVAWLLSTVGFRVAYHEHDSPDQSSSAPMSFFLRLARSARTECGRSAQICILPNEDRTAAFIESTHRTAVVQTVWNCASRQEADTPKNNHLAGTLRLVYQGSIGPGRLSLNLVHAMAMLPNATRHRNPHYHGI
jgi:hypothetical protein